MFLKLHSIVWCLAFFFIEIGNHPSTAIRKRKQSIKADSPTVIEPLVEKFKQWLLDGSTQRHLCDSILQTNETSQSKNMSSLDKLHCYIMKVLLQDEDVLKKIAEIAAQKSTMNSSETQNTSTKTMNDEDVTYIDLDIPNYEHLDGNVLSSVKEFLQKLKNDPNVRVRKALQEHWDDAHFLFQFYENMKKGNKEEYNTNSVLDRLSDSLQNYYNGADIIKDFVNMELDRHRKGGGDMEKFYQGIPTEKPLLITEFEGLPKSLRNEIKTFAVKIVPEIPKDHPVYRYFTNLDRLATLIDYTNIAKSKYQKKNRL